MLILKLRVSFFQVIQLIIDILLSFGELSIFHFEVFKLLEAILIVTI
jgi:hypothetical protein